jgi:hypothetical protein
MSFPDGSGRRLGVRRRHRRDLDRRPAERVDLGTGRSDFGLGSGGAPTVQIAASKRNSDGAGYMTIAMEGQAFTLASAETVRYGTGSKWTSKVVSGTGECTDAFFGNDKMTGLRCSARSRPAAAPGGDGTAPAPRARRCRASPAPAPAPPRHHGGHHDPEHHPTTSQTVVHGGIAVDTSSQPVPQPGVSSVMLTAPGAIPPAPAPGDWEADGAFRLLCNWSKMSYDDPIVYPGQAGAPTTTRSSATPRSTRTRRRRTSARRAMHRAAAERST